MRPWRHAPLLLFAILHLPTSAQAQLTEQLYQSACDDGDTSACLVFGLMSEVGEGVAQDFERAQALYRTACENGELVGCTNLGLMYAEGRGGPADPDEARGRFEIACEGDEEFACDLLDYLNDQDVDPDEVRYMKRGRVADATTTTALSDALIEIPELDVRGVSDPQGLVSLGRLPEGTYQVTAKRLGYLDLDAEIQVPGGTQFMILMDRAQAPDTAQYGRVFGRVTEPGGNAISDVDVTVVGRESQRAISNPRGRFGLADVEPGLVQVRLTRLGYAPRTATLVVQPGRTADLEAVLSPEAIELAPIEVTVRSTWLEQNGYYERSLQGVGRQFDREDIDRLVVFQPSELITRIPGVRLSDSRNLPGQPQYAVSPRVRSFSDEQCIMDLYIDGVLQADPDLNRYPPDWIEAVEVYTGATAPAQYSGLNPCGIVLMWTRR